MNFLLHQHKAPSNRVHIPTGLRELIGDISREVLREQPPNVITFIADYLDALLITRENTFVAKRTIDSLLDCTFNIITLMENKGISRDKAEQAATIIQNSFREHIRLIKDAKPEDIAYQEKTILQHLMSECDFTPQEAIRASGVIEMAYKRYFFRQKEYKFRTPYAVTWNNSVKNTLQIYERAGAQTEEMNRAAGTIQATYKSFNLRVRAVMNTQATIIQAAVMGYLARKETKAMKDAIKSIQQIYKSFKIRQKLNIGGSQVTGGGHKPLNQFTSAEAEAATVIASTFRSYKVRKLIEDEGVEKYMETLTKIAGTDEDVVSHVKLTKSKSRLFQSNEDNKILEPPQHGNYNMFGGEFAGEFDEELVGDLDSDMEGDIIKSAAGDSNA